MGTYGLNETKAKAKKLLTPEQKQEIIAYWEAHIVDDLEPMIEDFAKKFECSITSVELTILGAAMGITK